MPAIFSYGGVSLLLMILENHEWAVVKILKLRLVRVFHLKVKDYAMKTGTRKVWRVCSVEKKSLKNFHPFLPLLINFLLIFSTWKKIYFHYYWLVDDSRVMMKKYLNNINTLPLKKQQVNPTEINWVAGQRLIS